MTTNLQTTRRKRSTSGITSISIQGFKSLVDECSAEIRPLTILAGANSSGKSSIIQPLLMLKQTLEATYDPGPLLLHGPNVKFTSADQLFPKVAGRGNIDVFTISLEVDQEGILSCVFKKRPKKGVELIEMKYQTQRENITLKPDMTTEQIRSIIPKRLEEYEKLFSRGEKDIFNWFVDRSRCFLTVNFSQTDGRQRALPSPIYPPTSSFSTHIRKIIHVPGLRGNPERTYKTTAIGSEFPGTFENYVASVINHWQSTHDNRLKELGGALEALGLTWKVEARQIDDTQVELKVGRLVHSTRGGARDTVNIADVGFGVSQTLPVIVALLLAEKGQIVYVEQPEIHLHPRAQAAMAEILANSSKRGVKVVVETHSSLLLRAIQTIVAKGNIAPNNVKLHWFTRRSEDGSTEVHSANLDREGAFGDWPEDFDEVILDTEREYLDAAEAQEISR
jgi:predicted ATPase